MCRGKRKCVRVQLYTVRIRIGKKWNDKLKYKNRETTKNDNILSKKKQRMVT